MSTQIRSSTEESTSGPPTPLHLLRLISLSTILLIALLNFFGWWTESLLLVQLVKSSAPMQFNTALCFLLLASASLCPSQKNFLSKSLLLVLLCMTIAGATLLQYPLRLDLGFDTLLVTPFTTYKSTFAGRMAPNTALAFISSSLALIFLGRSSNFSYALTAGIFLCFSLAIGVLSIIGYAIDLETVYGWAGLNKMSLLTAICHALLSLSILIAVDRALSTFPSMYRYWHGFIAGFTGILISACLWLGANAAEQSSIQASFRHDSEMRGLLVQHAINSDLQALKSLERFFASSQDVTSDEFTSFVSVLRNQATTMIGIDWAPYIASDRRVEWEKKFHINIQSLVEMQLKPAKIHNEGYYPIQFTSSPSSVVDPLGLDHSSDPIRSAAIRRAHAENRATSTEPLQHFRIPADSSHLSDFIVFVPISRQSPLSAQASHPEPLGVIAGLFRFSTILQQQGLERGAHRLNAIAYYNSSTGPIPVTGLCNGNHTLTCKSLGMEHRVRIQIADQSWDVVFSPTSDYLINLKSSFPASILLLSLLFTTASVIYLSILRKKHCALLDSEERFRLLVDRVEGYAIFALDPQGFVVTWNEGAARLKGYAAHEIVGKHFSLFYSLEQNSNGVPQGELEYASKHGFFEEEGYRLRKDGSRFFARVLITRMLDTHGNLRGFSKVTRDITKEKLNEESLKAARDLAEAATRAKSDFVANVSHEIRTPLTSIIGFSEELIRTDPPKPERDGQLTVVLRNAKHLLRLINDILDFSKIEVGKLDIEAIKFSLIDLLKDVRTQMETRARNKGLWFKIHYQFPLPKIIRSDPTRIKQILFNLIENAIKFTKEGGIDVFVSFDSAVQVVRVVVKDTGIGLSQEQQQKIFDSFTQANASINREYGGTGLGLYISRQLAQKLGGTLVVDGSLDQGCEFTVTLSGGAISQVEYITEVPEPPITETWDLSAESVRFQGEVLLAEDMPDIQKLLRHILEQYGLKVRIAHDGEEVLSMTHAHTFDLIFMDLQMPKLDGLSATKELRNRGYYAPIVALTANLREAKVNAAIAAGCDGCLGKPFERISLQRILSLYFTENSGTSKSGNSNFQTTAAQFRTDFNRHFDTFQKLLAANDFELLARNSHALAGAAAFAYPVIYQLLADFESAAKNENLSLCECIFEKIRTVHQIHQT